jgi:cytidylate kinase
MSLIKIPYLLAIDGPAGSGKGTVAKLLSKKLNLNYLDSGAIYRLIALSAMEKKG